MCFDPVSLGLMAVGTGLSAYGSISGAKQQQNAYNAAQTAENNVLSNTLQQEQGFQNNNTAAVKDLVSKFAPAAQTSDLANAEATRDNTIGSTIQAPNAAPSGDFTPQIIKNVNAQKMLDAFNYATDVAKAKAKVGSYGDVMGSNARAISDTGGTVDMNNNFAKGVNAILPDQQQLAAASVYTPPSGAPGLYTALGNMMASAGASGKLGNISGSLPSLTAVTQPGVTGTGVFGIGGR